MYLFHKFIKANRYGFAVLQIILNMGRGKEILNMSDSFETCDLILAGCSSLCWHQAGVGHFRNICVSHHLVSVHTHLPLNTISINVLNNNHYLTFRLLYLEGK